MSTITPRQIDFINSLMDERNLFADERHFDRVNAMDSAEYARYLEHVKAEVVPTFSREQASRCIEALKALPYKDGAERRQPSARNINTEVPAGRYAIEGEDGTTDFYKVDRPTEGRWAGYVFVKLLVAQGGHGVESLGEQRLDRAHSLSVLRKIETAGVQAAMERFGRAIGSCGHCGRVLTNEESRERGIGPVCAAKMGWS